MNRAIPGPSQVFSVYSRRLSRLRSLSPPMIPEGYAKHEGPSEPAGEAAFPDGGGFKLRPVLVIHEHSDGDLLVVPVTTHDPRGAGDTPIALWQEAGLRLESAARMCKFATIAKVVVVKQLGSLAATDKTGIEPFLECFMRGIIVLPQVRSRADSRSECDLVSGGQVNRQAEACPTLHRQAEVCRTGVTTAGAGRRPCC